MKRPRSTARERQLRRIFVLDTNVLMHDPTAIFRFDEHDVYVPMIVLEELDAGKKGLSEAARNVRQVSRFLDELMASASKAQIDRGIELPTGKYSNGGKKQSTGRLFFQPGRGPRYSLSFANSSKVVTPWRTSSRQLLRDSAGRYYRIAPGALP